MSLLSSRLLARYGFALAVLIAAVAFAGPYATHSFLSSSAYAAALTPSQATALQNDLAAKMSAINAQTYPNEAAKQAAIAAAIAQVTENAIAAGADPGAVASAVIAAADNMNIASTTVGTGLGAAAANVSHEAAQQIAQVVRSQGSVAMRNAFSTSVASNGGPTDIIATNAGPDLFTSDDGVNNQGTNTDAPPPGCDNPSCS